jgi:hypothetical protein
MMFQRVYPVPHNKTGRLHGGNFALLEESHSPVGTSDRSTARTRVER